VSLGIFLLIAGAGCASRRESPQQQFARAIFDGNAAEASYIWHNMSARDRAAFTHGEGMKPQFHQGSINARIEQHESQESTRDSDNDDFPIVDLPTQDAASPE
jgi:hypothetical protein